MSTNDHDPAKDRRTHSPPAFPCIVRSRGVNRPAVEKYLPVLQQRRMIRWLKAAEHDPAAAALAAIIAECEPAKPCFSGACPVCGEGFQGFGMGVVERLIARPARGQLRGRMAMVSLIPPGGCVGPGELTAAMIAQAVDEMLAALKTAEMPACVIGVDISFDEDQTGQVPSHWCVHGHGPCLDWPAVAQLEALRRALPGTAMTSRPVHVKRLDGLSDERVAAYAFKPKRVRRVTYLDRSAEGRSPFRNTHIHELRPDQQVALANAEHEFGLMRRLVIHGLEADEVKCALDGL